MKYKWYYNWHISPVAKWFHFSSFMIVLAILSFQFLSGFSGLKSDRALADEAAAISNVDELVYAVSSSGSIADKDNSGTLKTKSGETELVNERTETFKKFQEADGSFRVGGQVGPVHYKKNPESKTEQFKEINLTILPTVNKEWNWAVEANEYSARFWQKKVVEEKEILYAAQFHRLGKSIEMAPVELVWENAAGERQVISKPVYVPDPIIDNNNYTITWRNAFGEGIDFRYNVSPDKFFKTVIINKKENPIKNQATIPEL